MEPWVAYVLSTVYNVKQSSDEFALVRDPSLETLSGTFVFNGYWEK